MIERDTLIRELIEKEIEEFYLHFTMEKKYFNKYKIPKNGMNFIQLLFASIDLQLKKKKIRGNIILYVDIPKKYYILNLKHLRITWQNDMIHKTHLQRTKSFFFKLPKE